MSILNIALNSGLTITIVIIILWLFKSYIAQYLIKLAGHQFDKDIEKFKADLQKKHQEHQQFHDLTMKTIALENKELRLRTIKAIDTIWQGLQTLKKFKIAVTFLGTLKIDEIKKHPSAPNIQQFLNSIPNSTLSDFLDESKKSTDNTELARPWITLRAWSLYSAYSMIILYAIARLDSARNKSTLDDIFDKPKMLETLKTAIPHIPIDNIDDIALFVVHDLIELSLLNELKNSIAQNEDEAAIDRAKKIYLNISQFKNNIQMEDYKMLE